MKKIPTIFHRNFETDHLVKDEINHEAKWVFDGEGVATQKLDGTCCMVRDGKLYKRYDNKKGRIAPADFEPAQDADSVTGHQPGWLPVGSGADDKWHREAFDPALPNGTYELCGPKINGNPEKLEKHSLFHHGDILFEDAPRFFNDLKEWFRDKDIEGIVFHHPDGRMAKIKKKDFGMKRSSQ